MSTPHSLVCPRPASSVCDPRGHLSRVLVDQINQAIQDIEAGRAPGKSAPQQAAAYTAQIAVAVVTRMAAGYTSKSFTSALFDRWGIGDKTKNDGLLLFLSLRDRQSFIRTGKGLNSRLSAGAIRTALAAMRPLLREGMHGEAILIALQSLQEALHTGPLPWYWRFWRFLRSFSFSQVVLLLWLIWHLTRVVVRMARTYWIRRTNRLRADLRRSQLEDRLQRLQRARQGEAEMCPICFDDMTLPGDGMPQDAEMLLCGHMFHSACLETWLSNNNTCPICRAANPRYDPPDMPDMPDLPRGESPRPSAPPHASSGSPSLDLSDPCVAQPRARNRTGVIAHIMDRLRVDYADVPGTSNLSFSGLSETMDIMDLYTRGRAIEREEERRSLLQQARRVNQHVVDDDSGPSFFSAFDGGSSAGGREEGDSW